jgi:hypothetical protein
MVPSSAQNCGFKRQSGLRSTKTTKIATVRIAKLRPQAAPFSPAVLTFVCMTDAALEFGLEETDQRDFLSTVRKLDDIVRPVSFSLGKVYADMSLPSADHGPHQHLFREVRQNRPEMESAAPPSPARCAVGGRRHAALRQQDQGLRSHNILINRRNRMARFVPGGRFNIVRLCGEQEGIGAVAFPFIGLLYRRNQRRCVSFELVERQRESERFVSYVPGLLPSCWNTQNWYQIPPELSPPQ